MWSNSVEERLQHMYLERDYLRVIDNAILNIEILNSRYHSNDFLRNNRNNRNNRNSRSFNRYRRNRTWNAWSNPNRNYIFSSGVTQPPVPPPTPPPPPPPLPPPPTSNTFSFYTRPTNTTRQTNTLNDFINNTLYTPSRPDYPTFNQVSSATTVMNFSDLSNNNCTICPISRDTFEPNDTIIKINFCGHVFKKDGLLSWFETNSRCPVCRHDIRRTVPTRQPPRQPTVNQDLSNNNVSGSTGGTNNTTNPISSPLNNFFNNRYSNSTDISNLYSNIGRNFLNYDLSNNDLDVNLNNILTENLTNVLDNIGTSVIENLAGSVEQALTQTLYTDLSNNNLATTLEYTMEFPPGRLT